MFGLDDVRGFFRPKQFYYSVNLTFHQSKGQGFTVVFSVIVRCPTPWVFSPSRTGSNVALRDLVNSIPCSDGFAVSSAHRICEEIEMIFVEKQK